MNIEVLKTLGLDEDQISDIKKFSSGGGFGRKRH